MNAIEWAVVFILVCVVLAGGNAARNWQNERHSDRQQEQLDLFQDGIELFPMYQSLEDIPDKIKKERCEQSKECFKLVEALVYEARSETREGQIAVASVILNRVDHPNFPDTIQGVISQPYQYSYLMDMHKQTRPTAKDWDKAFIVAYDVKHGVVERVSDALFYLNPRSVERMPRWAKEYEYVMTVDNHTFYRYP